MSSSTQTKNDEMQIENTTKKQDNLMWVEKYRPSTLNDLIAHEEITNTIRKLVKENKLPHLLFYGPPGKKFKSNTNS